MRGVSRSSRDRVLATSSVSLFAAGCVVALKYPVMERGATLDADGQTLHRPALEGDTKIPAEPVRRGYECFHRKSYP